MFDAATLREELTVIERNLRDRPTDRKLINQYVYYVRELRRKEYDENGYVTARNGVTGY